ncbi:MAG: hypothetical protein KKF27_21300, partial [Gammaproteobacteria bacterium]|nr:hypothetical protein [Gammaproteobacteria bacterium]
RNIILTEVWKATQYWLGMGKPVTLDLDDAYHMLRHSNPAHEFWNNRQEGQQQTPLEQLRAIMPLLDCFTSPSQLLLEDWLGVAQRTYWWPNWAVGKRYENLKKEPHEGCIIGWGGSSSHWDTFWFTPVLEALKRVCDLRPQVRVRICGFDRRIYDMVPLPEGRKEHVPYVPPDRWPANIAQFDIGIAPLAEEYDQRRSWLKGIEYMLARVPWIGTEGWPYKELARWGTLVPNDLDAWVGALIDHIDHPRDPMPGYLAGLDRTLERRAPELAQALQRIINLKKTRTQQVQLRGAIYV